jgi:hypothetical protein
MLVFKHEPEAITRTLAMMAYNPAIGRVLEKGCVDRFADLMVERIAGLYGVASRERFDIWHRETCKHIEESFKTSHQERVSYGQAQKPLNVFMKVYMGWAKQPTVQLAEVFTPFLHVPLDSLVMKFIAREFPEEYRSRIVPLRKSLLQWYGDRLERVHGKEIPRSLISSVIGQEFSLTAINQESYLAWQELLRSLYPAAPVRRDAIWAVERRAGRPEVSAT